jgi:hypothetical protein
MTEDDLVALLEQSRARNRQHSVTGMLLYAEGAFIQVLEGDAKDVETIYKSITLDERNAGHYVIEKSEITERNFPEWSMGFTDLTKVPADQLEGYSDIFHRQKALEDVAKCRDMAVALLLKF